MKIRLMTVAGALLASLLSLPVSAQSRPEMGGMGAETGSVMDRGPGHRAPQDCQQAADPGACAARREARDQALAACRELSGQQRRQCIQKKVQDFDCSKTGNPQQCENRKAAYEACQNQSGPAFRQCVQQKMPPVDCSKAPDQARCERHQQARRACGEKAGGGRKTCLQEQTGGE